MCVNCRTLNKRTILINTPFQGLTMLSLRRGVRFIGCNFWLWQGWTGHPPFWQMPDGLSNLGFSLKMIWLNRCLEVKKKMDRCGGLKGGVLEMPGPISGASFVTCTDNNPLTYILTTAKLNSTGHRWLASLANYNFSLQYHPGKINIDADALSK